jgi:hypothetical protein
VSSREIRCAASSLLLGLVDGPETHVEEAARTRVSVHYETGDARVPVLTVATPFAVRLPAALVTSTLPRPGPATVGLGRLAQRSTRWRVSRWWRPERPAGLEPPADVPLLEPVAGRALGVPVVPPTYDGLHTSTLVGRGPGLTPAGDDLLAGALVAAHATADPRRPAWRAETLATLATARTTTVSRALLHHACDGYAAPELAEFVAAVCGGGDVTRARARLLGVGHLSGAALMAGALFTLATHRLEGAA